MSDWTFFMLKKLLLVWNKVLFAVRNLKQTLWIEQIQLSIAITLPQNALLNDNKLVLLPCFPAFFSCSQILMKLSVKIGILFEVLQRISLIVRCNKPSKPFKLEMYWRHERGGGGTVRIRQWGKEKRWKRKKISTAREMQNSDRTKLVQNGSENRHSRAHQMWWKCL